MENKILINRIISTLGITEQDARFLYKLLPSSCCCTFDPCNISTDTRLTNPRIVGNTLIFDSLNVNTNVITPNVESVVIPSNTINFALNEYIDPPIGTTSFTLSNNATATFPPLVTRGGIVLKSDEYTVLGNTLTLTFPIVASGNGQGSEDVTIRYTF